MTQSRSNGLVARFREASQGPGYRWWALAAIECGNFVVYVDGFVVTMALPSMARDFGVGLHEIKWVLVAYLAALTVTLLLAGRLADRWGRKRVTVAGMTLLTLGAGLCAVAPNLPALVAFRLLQGLGGALALANVLAEITAVFPRDQRRHAMAINASVLAIGQITGLVLGGFLIDSLGWRAIFLVLVAVGGVGLALDLAVLRTDDSASAEAPMDWLGAALSILVVAAPFLLVERMSKDLGEPIGYALLAAGLVLLGVFLAVERRAAWPMLDLKLFGLRSFTCGSLAAAFYFVVATFGYVMLPLYAQVVLGLSPFSAGLLIVPLSLALTASSQLGGRLAGRISARVLSTIGLAFTCAGALGMSLLGTADSYWTVAGLLAFAGLGGGLFQPPNISSALSRVPPDTLGGASGVFTTTRNFGQAIGAALAMAILDHGLAAAGASGLLTHSADAAAPALDAYVQAQSFAFRVGAALGLVGVVASALRGD